MTGVRRTESDATRRWQGDVAAANELDEERRWVIWGTGAAPRASIPDAEEGSDVAWWIARGADPDWDQIEAADRWVLVARGEEDDIDAIAAEEELVRGYRPYLAEGKGEEMPDGYMKGTLRSDVGPRRKADQPRPYD